jgi:hypothetical protein
MGESINRINSRVKEKRTGEKRTGEKRTGEKNEKRATQI